MPCGQAAQDDARWFPQLTEPKSEISEIKCLFNEILNQSGEKNQIPNLLQEMFVTIHFFDIYLRLLTCQKITL